MAVKKAAAKAPAAKKSGASRRNNNVRYLDHQMVPIETLANYHKNPRKGNVRAIAESLFEHGQFRPIVVWTHEGGKQRPSPEILAGNHTYKGAKYLDQIAKGQTEKPDWITNAEKRLKRKVEPWPVMGVVFIDATAEEAAKIVIADNRTADLGDYDTEVMKDLLGFIPDAFGTGYTTAELELLANVSEKVADEAVEAIVNLDGYDPDEVESIVDLSAGLIDLEQDKIDDETPQVLLDANEELENSVHDLKVDPTFKTVTQFDYTPLRPDMMIEDLPDDLTTWAGSATRDLDIGEGYWFYNYGIDSTSGMKVQHGHIVLSFYAWDDYFDTWWHNLKERTAQALNSGITMALTPNFSMGSMPVIEAMYQFYKSRYVGRYMQEAGIRVMPDFEIRMEPMFVDLFKATTPEELAWGSIQVQNISAKTKRKDIDEKDAIDQWTRETSEFFDKVARPANLLVYANTNGFEMMSDLNDKKKWGMKLRYQPTRLIALGERAKQRTKKKGIV